MCELEIRDLNKLNDNLLKLGNTALDQFESCINNFGTQNLDEIKTVISNDKILDDLDDKVQKYGFEIIALRAPQAADLRRVVVALKIATIFERIGDYSRNISNRTKLLIELNYSDLPGVNIGKMGQKTQTMFEDVLEAYMNEDDKLAVKVRNSDFKVDKLTQGNYSNGIKTGKWFFWTENSLKEVDFVDSKITSVNEWNRKSELAISMK